MEKEVFEKPEIEFIELETDVICASGCNEPNQLAEIPG